MNILVCISQSFPKSFEFFNLGRCLCFSDSMMLLRCLLLHELNTVFKIYDILTFSKGWMTSNWCNMICRMLSYFNIFHMSFIPFEHQNMTFWRWHLQVWRMTLKAIPSGNQLGQGWTKSSMHFYYAWGINQFELKTYRFDRNLKTNHWRDPPESLFGKYITYDA